MAGLKLTEIVSGEAYISPATQAKLKLLNARVSGSHGQYTILVKTGSPFGNRYPVPVYKTAQEAVDAYENTRIPLKMRWSK